jgi:CheY-like chemotaxis protein
MRQSPPPRRLVIATAVDHAHQRVRLTVADSGPGISPDLLNRVFEPFFTTKPPGEGTGLGLSLCHSIVARHRGAIWAENRPEGGARFVIELPIEAHLEPQAADATADAPPPVRGKTVLVVDDEPEIGVVLGQILAVDGHQVDWASNGARALEHLGRRAYDLVISDLRMPEMDGPALYEAVLRRHPALATRFVFLTGDALGPVMEFVTRTGAPTVSKPFAVDDVRAAVRRALDGR